MTTWSERTIGGRRWRAGNKGDTRRRRNYAVMRKNDIGGAVGEEKGM